MHFLAFIKLLLRTARFLAVLSIYGAFFLIQLAALPFRAAARRVTAYWAGLMAEYREMEREDRR